MLSAARAHCYEQCDCIVNTPRRAGARGGEAVRVGARGREPQALLGDGRSVIRKEQLGGRVLVAVGELQRGLRSTLSFSSTIFIFDVGLLAEVSTHFFDLFFDLYVRERGGKKAYQHSTERLFADPNPPC